MRDLEGTPPQQPHRVLVCFSSFTASSFTQISEGLGTVRHLWRGWAEPDIHRSIGIHDHTFLLSADAWELLVEYRQPAKRLPRPPPCDGGRQQSNHFTNCIPGGFHVPSPAGRIEGAS